MKWLLESRKAKIAVVALVLVLGRQYLGLDEETVQQALLVAGGWGGLIAAEDVAKKLGKGGGK